MPSWQLATATAATANCRCRDREQRSEDEELNPPALNPMSEASPPAGPGLADAGPGPNRRRRRLRRLSFVCVNDVYSFDDLDSSAAAATPRGGWSRAATLMRRLRESSRDADFFGGVDDDCGPEPEEAVLTVVNGDVLGGSSLLQFTRGAAAIDVLNAIPVDLAALGNHEFDHGDEVLMERIAESRFDWLGSNVYYPFLGTGGDDARLTQEEVVGRGERERGADDVLHYFPGIRGNGKIVDAPNGLKLGVFGLVTKATPKISCPSEKVGRSCCSRTLSSITTSSPSPGAPPSRCAGEALSFDRTRWHISFTAGRVQQTQAEDRLLAADPAAGVDLVLGGHEHEPLASMVHREGGEAGECDGGRRNEGGVLVFKCGMNAYWVGKVRLDVVEDDAGVASISTSWSMHAVTPRIKEDAAVSEIVRRHRKRTEEDAMVSSFGRDLASGLDLDDVLATVGGTTSNGSRPTALSLDTRVSSVRRREATGGNLVADAMHWALETSDAAGDVTPPPPRLAMINGGFIRGDALYQPGSAIRVRDVLKELPFLRAMKVLEIHGSDLREGMAQQLRGSSRGPTGAFPHVSGNVRLRYDVADSADPNSADDRVSIRSFAVDGLEVSDAQLYRIAVTDFVAGGNEGCPSWAKGRCISNAAWDDIHMSCIFLKYLKSHHIIYPTLQDRMCLRNN
ncbi:hypothetical protein ACHAWF_015857 [Thalassiosira exigua]